MATIFEVIRPAGSSVDAAMHHIRQDLGPALTAVFRQMKGAFAGETPAITGVNTTEGFTRAAYDTMAGREGARENGIKVLRSTLKDGTTVTLKHYPNGGDYSLYLQHPEHEGFILINDYPIQGPGQLDWEKPAQPVLSVTRYHGGGDIETQPSRTILLPQREDGIPVTVIADDYLGTTHVYQQVGNHSPEAAPSCDSAESAAKVLSGPVETAERIGVHTPSQTDAGTTPFQLTTKSAKASAEAFQRNGMA